MYSRQTPSQMFTEDYQVDFMHEHHHVFDDLRTTFLSGEMVWNFADFMTAQSKRSLVLTPISNPVHSQLDSFTVSNTTHLFPVQAPFVLTATGKASSLGPDNRRQQRT